MSTLTPQEQAVIDRLDKDLPLTKTIDNLQQGQEQILKVIEDERESNKREFDKGSEKFKEVFSELKSVRSEVAEVKADFKRGVKEIVDTIHNKELSDLRDEVRNSKEKEKDYKMFWNGVAKTVLSAIIIAIVLYSLSKIGIVSP